jgi:O-antigen/teichoic acid export membrane protein
MRGIAFAARAHVATLLGYLMSRTSIVVLRHYGAYDSIGHWSIAAQISDALLLLPATVCLLLFPSLVRADVVQRWQEFRKMALRMSLVMALLCLVAAVLVGPFVRVLFGAAYAPTHTITYALLPGVFFLSLTAVASQFLSAFGIPWSQVVAWIVGWLVQVVLSVVLFKQFGVMGLALVQSGCAGFVCIWLFTKSLEYAPARAAVSPLAHKEESGLLPHKRRMRWGK